MLGLGLIVEPSSSRDNPSVDNPSIRLNPPPSPDVHLTPLHQDSMYGAPTMSIGVEAQIILRQARIPSFPVRVGCLYEILTGQMPNASSAKGKLQDSLLTHHPECAYARASTALSGRCLTQQTKKRSEKPCAHQVERTM